MFCDMCGCETEENYVSNRAVITWGDWKVEAMVAHKDAWNSGILCNGCLRDVLFNGSWGRARQHAVHETVKEEDQYRGPMYNA